MSLGRVPPELLHGDTSQGTAAAVPQQLRDRECCRVLCSDSVHRHMAEEIEVNGEHIVISPE